MPLTAPGLTVEKVINWRHRWQTATTAQLDRLELELEEIREVWAATRARYGFARRPAPVLSDGNPKLEKGDTPTVGLSLAPAGLAGFGTVCPFSTPQCRAGCLHYAGRAARSSMIPRARAARTAMMAAQPHALACLVRLELKRRLEREPVLAFRPNVLSDLVPGPWLLDLVLEHDRRLIVYDYTKRGDSLSLVDGIDRTYSVSERQKTPEAVLEFLEQGHRVAIVSPVSKEWTPSSSLVVDGDKTDERWRDPRPGIVVLRPKGKIRNAKPGPASFVKPTSWLVELEEAIR